MRLSENELEVIKNGVKNHLSDFELYLFGSRIDDDELGGDIDLLILTEEKFKIEVKWNIRREITSKIGDQKIDIVNFTFDSQDNFKLLILDDAVRLL